MYKGQVAKVEQIVGDEADVGLDVQVPT
jgi:hypothetical protein